MTDFTKLSPEDLARVTTRDGRKVEIITTKGREPWPIVGYIGGGSDVLDWRASGAYINDISIENPADLILPPAPRVYYANAYPEGVVVVGHRSPSAARNAFSPGWLALYKITDDGVNATIEVIERNKEGVMRYLLALLLAGCAVTMRPNAYEWYADMPPSEYYRWEVVDDPELCGRTVADAWNGWACAIRLSAGVIRPGDRRIDGGPVTAEEGRLCVVFSSMTEEAAKRRRSKWETRSLFAHEMQHCAGFNHREVFR